MSKHPNNPDGSDRAANGSDKHFGTVKLRLLSRRTLADVVYRLFSTLCDNFCLWNREMLTRQHF
ncbi:MAG: hypothetical protein EWV82_10845 [Microcystis aeruginosa Ma_AC_P_19900807_S299]|nr:MAG: hypothetical protein EWV82_10845 [Microcystis aeruginosa Ma_AC_P_19900807_S299]